MTMKSVAQSRFFFLYFKAKIVVDVPKKVWSVFGHVEILKKSKPTKFSMH